MPRVPNYQPNQVGPVETTQARLRPANNNGGALGGFGEGLQTAGKALGQYAEAQDQLNAENDATQARLLAADAGMAYSTTTTEFEQLQAGAARQAQPEYDQRLTKIKEETLSKAANPRQQRFLEARLGELHDASATQIFSHALKQQKVEKAQGFGALETSYSEQAAAATDPHLRDQLIASAVAVRRDKLAQIDGIDPKNDPTTYSLNELEVASKIHGAVMDNMFSSADPNIDEISHYLAAYGDEMTANLKNDVLKRLQSPLQGRQARGDADQVMGLAVPVETSPAPVAGGSGANLDGITANAESGGREYTSGGQRVTSPAGARGMFQVMPSTARDPGFGIRPSDGTPAEDARVGKEYRAKMERRYGGDLQKMWAAYNWGPGNVDNAIDKYGDNWLAHAPDETKTYVLKNVAAVGGERSLYTNEPREWDRAAVYKSLEATAAKEGWSPERTERARQELDRRAQRDEGLLQDQRKAADEQVATIVEAKGAGFTSTTQIPRNVWNTLSPTDKMQWEKVAEANAKPKEPEANSPIAMGLARMAIENPTGFASLNLAKYAPFVTRGELDTFNQSQARAAKAGTSFDARPPIDSTISRQKKWAGVDVDKDPAEGFRVRRYMETQADELRSKQKEPTQQDYDRWFREATQQVHVTRSFAGIDYLRPDTTSRSSQILSPTFRAVITREFRQTFGRDPTEPEVQDWFEKMGKPSA